LLTGAYSERATLQRPVDGSISDAETVLTTLAAKAFELASRGATPQRDSEPLIIQWSSTSGTTV